MRDRTLLGLFQLEIFDSMIKLSLGHWKPVGFFFFPLVLRSVGKWPDGPFSGPESKKLSWLDKWAAEYHIEQHHMRYPLSVISIDYSMVPILHYPDYLPLHKLSSKITSKTAIPLFVHRVNAAYEAPTYEEVMTTSAPAIWTIASNPSLVPSPLNEPPPYNVVIESSTQEDIMVEALRVSVPTGTRGTSETDIRSRMELQLVLPPRLQRFVSDIHEVKGIEERFEPLEPLTPPPAYESAINNDVFEDTFQPSILSLISPSTNEEPNPHLNTGCSWREGESADIFHAWNCKSLSHHYSNQSWTTDNASDLTRTFSHKI